MEEHMLRDVVEADLPIFYQQQLDPEATRMAAFHAREDWTVFLAHWRTKVLGVPTCCKQTIVWNDRVAGYVSSWLQDERRLVAYWIGREYWGRGIASAALAEFLDHDLARPLHAFVAAHNIGSCRVLEKNGFVRMRDATTSPDAVEEYLYRLS
jgi:RimJ/RimL family protein N-acetyltransferase